MRAFHQGNSMSDPKEGNRERHCFDSGTGSGSRADSGLCDGEGQGRVEECGPAGCEQEEFGVVWSNGVRVARCCLPVGGQCDRCRSSGAQKKGYQGSSIVCSECGADARFVNYRACRPLTLLGDVIYERAYYHCAACHSGHFPTDAEFGLEHKQTVAARELIALAGLLHPFEETGDTVLPRLSGLHVSASTVRRTTEAVGADVAERRKAG